MRTSTLFIALAATFPVFAMGSLPDGATQSPAVVQEVARVLPRQAWLPGDPADSLYREARAALRRNDFVRAASLFREVRQKYPRSGYAPESYYWEAFALYRTGTDTNLRTAREVLRLQRERHPDAYNQSEPQSLDTRICGVLANRGDAECARVIAAQAQASAGGSGSGSGAASASASSSASATSAASGRGRRNPGGPCDNEEEDMRVAALNALLQMDSERALPILQRVLARRDECSEVLRRKAIFLVSQKQGPETENILLSAARNDPDSQVREQAIFWLSQVNSERAATALDSILRSSTDRTLQEKAIFALSQMNRPGSMAALRAYVERADAPEELRGNAIFWLGQQNRGDNASYLQQLYGRVNSKELKEKIIFSLSQMNGGANRSFLMDIAMNEREDIEMRKRALFWAGQNGGNITELVNLYGRLNNTEMKEQLIFVYSQRNDRAAADKLVDIARNDPNPEMRKKALFWLSQSNDPRVADILQDIIDQ